MKRVKILGLFLSVLVFLSGCSPAFGERAIEIETYECGYEVTHVDMIANGGFSYCLSARNDLDAFSIPVPKEDYKRYCAGDIIHVEVQVMKKGNRYYNEYTILGREGFV